jgi:hypothetical protein
MRKVTGDKLMSNKHHSYTLLITTWLYGISNPFLPYNKDVPEFCYAHVVEEGCRYECKYRKNSMRSKDMQW